MNRKQLEIELSRMVQPFSRPKIKYEQYQTPPRVAANLLHLAWTRGDIESRSVIDLCAGTGILGIGATLLGAEVTMVEFEDEAFDQLQANIETMQLEVELIQNNALSLKAGLEFDTAVLNPPFGIQQKVFRDLDFVEKAGQLAQEIYSVHDGSEKNQEQLPSLLKDRGLEPVEAYIDQFPLDQSYPWHKMRKKIQQVLVIHSRS